MAIAVYSIAFATLIMGYSKFIKNFFALIFTLFAIFTMLNSLSTVVFTSSFFRSVDEVLLIVLTLIAGFRHFSKTLSSSLKTFFPPWTVLMIMFLSLGIISAINNGVSHNVWLPQSFIYIKSLLIGFVILAARPTIEMFESIIIRTVFLFSGLTIFGAIAQLLISNWLETFSLTYAGAREVRFGLHAFISIYTHPGHLAVIATLLALSSLAIYLKSNRRMFLFLAICNFIICILSLRRRSILAILVGLFILLIFALHEKNKSSVVLVNIFGLGGLIYSIPIIVNVISGLRMAYFDLAGIQARSILYLLAPQIANDNFPGGSGFGTYGTYLSVINYSSIYSDYGISSIWGLGRDETFITDTFWPGIIGETGWFGLSIYVLIIFLSLKYMIQWFRWDHKNREYSILFISIWFILIIDSIAAPTFLATPNYVFLPACSTIAWYFGTSISRKGNSSNRL